MEEVQPQDDKLHIPESCVPKVVDLHHISPGFGGHNGFWKTYIKLRKHFVWKDMKKDLARFV